VPTCFRRCQLIQFLTDVIGQRHNKNAEKQLKILAAKIPHPSSNGISSRQRFSLADDCKLSALYE
jgi:hypothetical protein